VTISSFDVVEGYCHAWADGNFPTATAETVLQEDVKLTTDAKDEAGRTLLTVAAVPSQTRLVKVTYSNMARWYQRWIVGSCTVIDEDGVPMYKKDGSVCKGPLRLVAEDSGAEKALESGSSVFNA
jgi:hypothetical protein